MTESAFGIDHGDVSKSYWGPNATKKEKQKFAAKGVGVTALASAGAGMGVSESKGVRAAGLGLLGAGAVGAVHTRHNALKNGVVNPQFGEKTLYKDKVKKSDPFDIEKGVKIFRPKMTVPQTVLGNNSNSVRTTHKGASTFLKPKSTERALYEPAGETGPHVRVRNFGGGLTRRGKQAVGGAGAAAGAAGGAVAANKDKIKKNDPFGIEKAFKMPGSFKPKMPKPVTALGNKVATSTFNAGDKVATAGVKRMGKPGGVSQKIGNAQSKVGVGAMKTGMGMASRPGTTGAATGAAGAAGGYAAFKAAREKKMKKPGQV